MTTEYNTTRSIWYADDAGGPSCGFVGVHPNTLRYSIRKGRTRAVKVARTWYIPVADVEEQRAQFNERMEGK